MEALANKYVQKAEKRHGKAAWNSPLQATKHVPKGKILKIFRLDFFFHPPKYSKLYLIPP
jgi:hypothetical protein